MHGTAVVPKHEIADLPDIVPCRLFALRVGPELIQQCIRFGEFEALNQGITTASQIQHPPASLGVGADEWMECAWRFAEVITGGYSLTNMASAIISAVVLDA